MTTAIENDILSASWSFNIPRDQCIHHLFEEQVTRTTAAVAIVDQCRRICYGDLNQRANRIAHHLQSLGVGPDSLVGICARRSTDLVAGVLAILKSGAAYLPLDPSYPPERLKLILDDAQPGIILTEQALRPLLSAEKGCINFLLDADFDYVPTWYNENPRSDATNRNLAYVLYTSGSTGRPKGVAIEHSSTLNFLQWAAKTYSRNELSGVLFSTSLCFDLSVFELFVPLCCGGTVILAENALFLPDLPAANEVTLINTVPSALAQLVQREGLPPSVQTVNLAGEVLQASLAERIYEQPNIRKLYNLYGPTEYTTYATFEVVGRDGQTPTIGRPLLNTRVYLLDDDLQHVDLGESGELCIGGPGLARGYLDEPELTSQKFIPDPFSGVDGARLYRTGDRARYLPDGRLVFLGRSDHQIKLRGFRIELEEIEAVLSRHPSASQCAVSVREDSPGDTRLVAYVVRSSPSRDNLDASNNPALEQIRRWQAVYEGTYQQLLQSPDPCFNTIGWNSSYSGLPIPESEMREWLDATVQEILPLNPSRVLDIGCGSGLLLFEIAPRCTAYCGADFSETTLDVLEPLLKAKNLSQVSLSHRTADDFDGLEPRAFDVVILNAVVEHFPNIDYLLNVLEGAVRMVKPGGHIFVGDVRNLLLLESYHASVLIHQSSPAMRVDELRRQVHKGMDRGGRLAVDPEFFFALRRRLPEIDGVQIKVRRGRHHNEMTKFRYNAILRVGDPTVGDSRPIDSAADPKSAEPKSAEPKSAEPKSAEPKSAEQITWFDWEADSLSLHKLQDMLLERKHAVIGVRSIPNQRTFFDVAAADMTAKGSGRRTVGEMRRALAEKSMATLVDPEGLWNLGDFHSWQVEVTWSRNDPRSCVDAVFHQASHLEPGFWDAVYGLDEAEVKPWSDYGNDPGRQSMRCESAVELRSYLKQQLPEYMLPSELIILDSLPLLPNGKIDRAQLPECGLGTRNVRKPYVGCRSTEEELVAAIWRDVLRIHDVGIHDDFFELGGHSLLAVRLLSEIEKQCGKRLPLSTMLHSSTIESLAALLREDEPAAGWRSLVSIQPEGSKSPLFAMHTNGGHVLFYRELSQHLGKDQPFYGLQARGMDGSEPPDERIEDMAAHYVEEILRRQPTGPFFLTGMCLGADIALEVAQQLRSRGETVGLLAILDSWPLQNSESLTSWPRLRRYATNPSTLLTAIRVRLLNPLFSQLKRRSLRDHDIVRDRLLELHSRARLRYRAKPYPGRTVLFLNGECAYGGIRVNLDGILRECERFAAGDFEYCIVPGSSHEQFLSEPDVKILAERLKFYLEQDS